MKRLPLILAMLALVGMVTAVAFAQEADRSEGRRQGRAARGEARVRGEAAEGRRAERGEMTDEERERRREVMEARREELRLRRGEAAAINEQIASLAALRRLELSEEQQQQVARILENARQRIVRGVLTDEQREQLEAAPERPQRRERPARSEADDGSEAPRRQWQRGRDDEARPEAEGRRVRRRPAQQETDE